MIQHYHELRHTTVDAYLHYRHVIVHSKFCRADH